MSEVMTIDDAVDTLRNAVDYWGRSSGDDAIQVMQEALKRKPCNQTCMNYNGEYHCDRCLRNPSFEDMYKERI